MIVGHLLRYVFEPGFFGSGPVHVAFAVGTVIAVTSAVVGVFTVTRGQSFAGHALGDIATTGGSGAFLIGLNQFWGYLAFGMGAAAVMEMIGVQRRRGRDVATGVVLGAALGLAALFLYLGTQQSSTTGASFTILFGSLFAITPSTVPALITSALLALATVVVLARVLLLSSLSPDIAAARGVPVRAVGVAFLMALAVSVALSAMIIGAVLSTALLIGPAATALRVAKGPVRAAATAAGIGVAAVWLGIVLAYDSFSGRRPARLAGQLLRGHAGRRRLPGHLPAPGRTPAGRAGKRRCGGRCGAGMFSGLMMNTWIAATAVAVIAGVTGFFAVLRGRRSRRTRYLMAPSPGAAGASLLGLNAFAGLAAFSVAGALGIAGLSRRARHDVATALTFVMMLAVGALFVSWSTEYAQEAYSLLFGEVFGVDPGDVPPILALGVVSIAVITVMFRPLMLSSAMPEVARGARDTGPPDGPGVPARDGPGHQHDRACGGRAADVQPDDRARSGGQVADRAAGPRDDRLGGDRADHGLDGHRGLVSHQLAARLLRRRNGRRLLPARPGLCGGPPPHGRPRIRCYLVSSRCPDRGPIPG